MGREGKTKEKGREGRGREREEERREEKEGEGAGKGKRKEEKRRKGEERDKPDCKLRRGGDTSVGYSWVDTKSTGTLLALVKLKNSGILQKKEREKCKDGIQPIDKHRGAKQKK